jgi:lysozyme family protein
MTDRFDICLAFTLKTEGGYVDNPADPGGATNMGITLATLRQWSDDPGLGPTQVEDITQRTARAIYRSLYWNPLRTRFRPVSISACSTWASTPAFGDRPGCCSGRSA